MESVRDFGVFADSKWDRSGRRWIRQRENAQGLIQKLFLFFNLISVVKNPSLHPKYVRHVQNRIHYVIHGNTNRIAQSK